MTTQQSKLAKNGASFAADLNSVKIIAQNIRNIRIGLTGLGTGTTATTLPTQVAGLADIKLTVGSEIETLIKHIDLFVLNFILHDIMPDIVPSKPVWLLSTTTDNTALFLKTILPVDLTTDKEIYLDIAYTGIVNADTLKLSIAIEYGDIPRPNRPISLKYISPSAAASLQEYDFSNAGRKLIGLLVFATTIPNGTTLESSCEELKLLSKSKEKYHTTWYNMDFPDVDVEDTLVHGIADNYRYLDFRKDPIPADDLKISFKSVAATDTVRFIGVFQ